MNKKIEPLKCRCGGNPVLEWLDMSNFNSHDQFYIHCDKCGIETEEQLYEEDAIEAWNKVMKDDKETSVVTANTQGSFTFYSCECGCGVFKGMNYCCRCGKKLVW